MDVKDDDASIPEVFKPFSSNKKKKSHKKKSRTAEIMAAKRRKIWSNMAKKEVGKVVFQHSLSLSNHYPYYLGFHIFVIILNGLQIHRSKMNNHKEMLTQCRKVANYCMRYSRQKAMQVRY